MLNSSLPKPLLLMVIKYLLVDEFIDLIQKIAIQPSDVDQDFYEILNEISSEYLEVLKNNSVRIMSKPTDSPSLILVKTLQAQQYKKASLLTKENLTEDQRSILTADRLQTGHPMEPFVRLEGQLTIIKMVMAAASGNLRPHHRHSSVSGAQLATLPPTINNPVPLHKLNTKPPFTPLRHVTKSRSEPLSVISDLQALNISSEETNEKPKHGTTLKGKPH